LWAFFVLVPSSAVERLQAREVEKARLLHDQIIEAQEQENIRALQNIIKHFVSKIELGYNQALVWYTYPLEENGINSHGNSHQKTLLLGTKSLVLKWS
jgi:ABC-type iron transport system FetAB ATPase subunit